MNELYGVIILTGVIVAFFGLICVTTSCRHRVGIANRYVNRDLPIFNDQPMNIRHECIRLETFFIESSPISSVVSSTRSSVSATTISDCIVDFQFVPADKIMIAKL